MSTRRGLINKTAHLRPFAERKPKRPLSPAEECIRRYRVQRSMQRHHAKQQARAGETF